VRTKIKRLLRKHKYQPPKPSADGGGGLRLRGQLVLDQAKSLYRYWPDVDVGDQLSSQRRCEVHAVGTERRQPSRRATRRPWLPRGFEERRDCTSREASPMRGRWDAGRFAGLS
jgi:hypothetical protein